MQTTVMGEQNSQEAEVPEEERRTREDIGEQLLVRPLLHL